MPQENGATGGANNTPGQNIGDTANAANTGAGEQNQSATGGAQNEPGKTDDAGATTGKITFTPEQQAYVNSLVKAEKDKEVAKINKRIADEKDLSEKQIAEKRASEAENALAERDKKDAFREATETAKIIDLKALYLLIGGELEFENGKFKNLTKVLDQAKVSYPYLFPKAEGSADGGKKDDKTEPEATPGVGRMAQAYGQNAKS
ncbi:MAG TPA: hypothetical protein VF692_02975 [Pyrinomonadaceae bacterium]|jgi:hypothetical protein